MSRIAAPSRPFPSAARRCASALLVLLLAMGALPAAAADVDVRLVELHLDLERRLLAEGAQRWARQLEEERRAAQAVEAAASSLAGALSRLASPAAAAPQPGAAPASLADLAAALHEAERALAGHLSTSRGHALVQEQQALRVGALSAALEALRQRGPAAPLDGTWDVAVQPLGRGQFRLTQVGTLVTGDYVMEDRASGSLTGTFAAGRLRLERIDAVAGRDAIFEGSLIAGRLEGTWLATIFGRGTPESGRFVAQRRSELVAPPPEAEQEP